MELGIWRWTIFLPLGAVLASYRSVQSWLEVVLATLICRYLKFQIGVLRRVLGQGRRTTTGSSPDAARRSGCAGRFLRAALN